MIRRRRSQEIAERKLTNDSPPAGKRSALDLLERHDPSIAYPKLIKAALAKMLKTGREHWLYEKEFCSLSTVGTGVIGRYRDAFESHIVLVPGRDGRAKASWFADPKVATRVRNQLRKSIPNYDDDSTGN